MLSAGTGRIVATLPGHSYEGFDGVIRVLDVCSDCQSAGGLLHLAALRGRLQLSARERAAADDA